MKRSNYSEYNVNYISGCMSLRKPQERSLKILDDICNEVELGKTSIEDALVSIHDLYPTCSSFERDFVSLTFALATGVGKTRLMGAFITYLYTVHGIKNFFVVAPNITIYNKLKSDLSDTTSPKYVFKGLGCFSNPPTIVSGENYKQKAGQIGMSEVTINIFNISKFNKDATDDKKGVPQMKRLSEFIGDSYFDYLSKLDDLVLIMDESHHYRADKSAKALNDLKPILGLELTATPQVETGRATPEKFKNVVYEYSLAKALRDGFVKVPYAMTRQDLENRNFSDEELDKMKIMDGIANHENIKSKLLLYAENNDKKVVKPFVLIVCKDTEHAAEVVEFIKSNECYNGNYKNKVIIVHSNQKGMEKDENIEKLVSVEKASNPVEIVVHVNMLKEGWDVTNLYTIIPLRTATSKTLREQTIGRGLRLPYGQITGDKDVDRLTIVAHEKFKAIVDEANRPDSLIRQENIILAEEIERRPSEVVKATTVAEEESTQLSYTIAQEFVGDGRTITEDDKKALNQVNKIINNEINSIAINLASTEELKTEVVKEQIAQKVSQQIQQNEELQSFKDNFADIIESMTKKLIELQSSLINKNVIEIPLIVVQPSLEVNKEYRDFDIDLRGFDFVPQSTKILLQNLQNNELEESGLSAKDRLADTEANVLVGLLCDKPEIDYYECSDLLFKLVNQVLTHLHSKYNDEEVKNIVLNQKQNIADLIFTQIMKHFYVVTPKMEVSVAKPRTKIIEPSYQKYSDEPIKSINNSYADSPSQVRSSIYNGFKKATHKYYKFDSTTEKDFAIVCESSSIVEKWMRPASKQFSLYWGQGREHNYEPDFVVETNDTIYLVETKDHTKVDTEEVLMKANTAKTYCEAATSFNRMTKKKTWKYLLIPDDKINTTSSFETLAARFSQ